MDKGMAKNKYMKCETCHKLIPEGSKFIEDETCIGAYCSIQCWAISRGRFKAAILTEDIVKEQWGLTRWDVEEDE